MLRVAILLLFAASVMSQGVQVHHPMSNEVLEHIQSVTGIAALEAAKPGKTGVMLESSALTHEDRLPELPGSEIIGIGFDARRGFTLDSATRTLLNWDTSVKERVEIDDKLAFSVPQMLGVRRVFQADMSTQVFDSAEARSQSMAIHINIEVEAAGNGGKFKLDIESSSTNQKKEFISSSILDVHLWDIGLVRANSAADFDPLFLAEFDALPDMWDEDPIAFETFILRWGTHYLKNVQVGGRFNMDTHTYTSADTDRLRLGLFIAIQFSAGVVSGKGELSLDTKMQSFAESLRNRYEYTAHGGDPVVAGLLAAAGAGSVADRDAALLVWLQSVKSMPQVFDFKVAPITALLRVMSTHPNAKNKALALENAVSIHLRDGFPFGKGIAVLPAQAPVWSNFQRLPKGCITFSASLALGSTLNFHMSPAPGRSELGYRIALNSDGVSFFKGKKMVYTTDSSDARAPGSASLIAAYLFCFRAKDSTLSYGRGDRVVTVWRDPEPESALFYAFSIDGPLGTVISGLVSTPLEAVQCPYGRGTPCNSPHGQCNADRQCVCEEGYFGAACESACPMFEKKFCGGPERGYCEVGESGRDAQPFCECRFGHFGPACEFGPTASALSIGIIGFVPLPPPTPDPNDEYATPPPPGPPQFQVMSGRSSVLQYKFEAQSDDDDLIAALAPSEVVWEITEANVSPVSISVPGGVSLEAAQLTRNFAPGHVDVSVRIAYPHSIAVARAVASIDVVDCSCSGRGRCAPDPKNAGGIPICVCDLDAAGLTCNLHSQSGLLELTPSADHSAESGERTDIAIRFAKPFASPPKLSDVNVKVEFKDQSIIADLASDALSARVSDITAEGCSLNIARVLYKVSARVVYTAVAPRLVGAQSGVADVSPPTISVPTPPPPNDDGTIPSAPPVPEPQQIISVRFPAVYQEAPYVTAELASPPCCNERFKIEVLPSSSGADVRFRVTKIPSPWLFPVSSMQTTSAPTAKTTSTSAPSKAEMNLPLSAWTQPLKIKWTARPLPISDAVTTGVSEIGPAFHGPKSIDVFFPHLFRNPPRAVAVQGFRVCCDQAFEFTVLEPILRDRFRVRASLLGGNPMDGWLQNLQISWRALPANSTDDDVESLVPSVSDIDYVKNTDYPYIDLRGSPVHLPPTQSSALVSQSLKGHETCAMLCMSRPQCRAFSYHFTHPDPNPKSAPVTPPPANPLTPHAASPRLVDPAVAAPPIYRSTDMCSLPQADVEKKYGGYCYLKGTSSTWQTPNPCSISGILPDKLNQRHFADEVAFELSAGCVPADGQIKITSLRDAACPTGSLMRGFRFSNMLCGNGGVSIVLTCAFSNMAKLNTGTLNPLYSTCPSKVSSTDKAGNFFFTNSSVSCRSPASIMRGFTVRRCPVGDEDSASNKNPMIQTNALCQPVLPRGASLTDGVSQPEDVASECANAASVTVSEVAVNALSTDTEVSSAQLIAAPAALCPAGQFVASTSIHRCTIGSLPADKAPLILSAKCVYHKVAV